MRPVPNRTSVDNAIEFLRYHRKDIEEHAVSRLYVDYKFLVDRLSTIEAEARQNVSAEIRAMAIRTIAWIRESSVAITEAGGRPDHILEKIPDDLLETMVRNNIFLSYVPEKDS